MDRKRFLKRKEAHIIPLIVKALLFVYFEYRQAFEVNSIIVEIDNNESETYTHEKILQVFSKKPNIEIDGKQQEVCINCNKMFLGNRRISDSMMIALMNLTLSYYDPGNSFDYAWKCFNALYREIFNKGDVGSLEEIGKELEKDKNIYNSILSFASSIDINYLEKCSFRGMIFYKDTRNSKRLSKLFPKVKDYRVCEVLLSLKDINIDDHIKSSEYSTITSEYKNSIANKLENPSDIVQLLILNYAYYLRCKYFHAEKWPSNFLIRNRNYIELNRIRYPLSLLCKDLMENRLY